MAEEVQKVAQEEMAKPVGEEVVVVADVPLSEKMTSPPPPPPPPVPETEEEPLKLKQGGETEVVKPSGDPDEKKHDESLSLKEESTKVGDLLDCEKKAVEELRELVREALNKHEFSDVNASDSPPKEEDKEAAEEQKPAQEEAKPEAEAVKAEEAKEDGLKEEKAVNEENNNGSVDDDGAKTVEAIEETVVAVSSSAPQEQTVQEANEKTSSTVEEEGKDVTSGVQKEEVSIWGIPLLADERSDVILLKFLRARDFKVNDAFVMLKNTIRWRKEFGIDELLEEDLGDDLGKAVFMHGVDKEGHPVCYNVYGEFQDKELYQKCFSDEEKRNKFLKWRIQFLEKSIRKLDFSPGGVSTIFQVNDLKNSPGLTKTELRQATKRALQVLQDNYPEFVAKQVFINVPWWYLAFNKMISPFLTQRTRSKFLFAGPSRSAETLFRYIAAEQLPVKYGGLSKDGDFGTADSVTEITVKPAAKHTVEFPVSETCLLTWEVRVVGWDVNYGAEFVPSAGESYTVIIQKARKIAATEEPVVCNSFKIGEPGKIVLTIDNPTSRKKKLLYRLKTKISSD